jgi:hypothetical protein
MSALRQPSMSSLPRQSISPSYSQAHSTCGCGFCHGEEPAFSAKVQHDCNQAGSLGWQPAASNNGAPGLQADKPGRAIGKLGGPAWGGAGVGAASSALVLAASSRAQVPTMPPLLRGSLLPRGSAVSRVIGGAGATEASPGSFGGMPAFIAAIFHVCPILLPLLAPSHDTTCETQNECDGFTDKHGHRLRCDRDVYRTARNL